MTGPWQPQKVVLLDIVISKTSVNGNFPKRKWNMTFSEKYPRTGNPFVKQNKAGRERWMLHVFSHKQKPRAGVGVVMTCQRDSERKMYLGLWAVEHMWHKKKRQTVHRRKRTRAEEWAEKEEWNVCMKCLGEELEKWLISWELLFLQTTRVWLPASM